MTGPLDSISSGLQTPTQQPIDEAALQAAIAAYLAANPQGSVHPGTFIWFCGLTAPNGYLVCDGSEVSRTLYADLFAAIDTIYGAGDGNTTFNLPDARGEFLRGWDTGGNVDPNRSLGSFQAETRISNAIESGVYLRIQNPDSTVAGGSVSAYNSINRGWGRTYQGVRPRNIALLGCIKT